MFEDNYIVDDVLDNDNHNFMMCDIYEKDNNYHILLDVPGYEKANLKVEYNSGYLSISGTKKNETKENGYKYIRKERSYGVYKRDFYVGEIDYTKIIARYRDGVLTITLPKADKSVNTKNIVIK